MKYCPAPKPAFLPPPSRLLRFILGVCAFVGFSGCITSDSGVETVKVQIDKSPQPDAIVGLWHRKNEGLTSAYSGTFLFKSDGTAYFTNTSSRAVSNYQYHYQGGGVWELFYIDTFKNKYPNGTASLAGDRLITTDRGISLMYQRQKD